MTDTAPATKRPSGARIALALCSVYLFWGGTYLGMKYAIQTMPPFLMAGLRFIVAGWILYANMRIKGEPRPSFAEMRNAGITGILLLVLGNGVVAMAEQQVPSAIASVLIATVPLWITGITYLTDRKKPGIGSMVGIVMGLVGVGVLVWNPGSLSDHPVNTWGIIAILFAALAWSIGSIVSRKTKLPKAPLLSTAVQMIVGGSVLLLVAAFHGDFTNFHFSQVSQSSWLAMGYLVVFGSLLGYTAYIWLFRNAEPSVATTYAYVNPIVAMLLGWLVAGEQLGANAIIAAAIIIASVIVITLFRDKSGAVSPGGKATASPADAPTAAQVK